MIKQHWTNDTVFGKTTTDCNQTFLTKWVPYVHWIIQHHVQVDEITHYTAPLFAIVSTVCTDMSPDFTLMCAYLNCSSLVDSPHLLNSLHIDQHVSVRSFGSARFMYHSVVCLLFAGCDTLLPQWETWWLVDKLFYHIFCMLTSLLYEQQQLQILLFHSGTAVI